MSVRLNYACPRLDPNMCYWCGGAYSSAFFAWEVNGKLYSLSNILDRPQLQKSGKFEQIFVPSDISNNFNFAKLCDFILKKYKQKSIEIPWNFVINEIIHISTSFNFQCICCFIITPLTIITT